MFRFLICVLGSGLIVSTVTPREVRAETRKVVVMLTWHGSMDRERGKDDPEFITDAKTLAKKWADWNMQGPVPDGIDLTKSLVAVVYTSGSNLQFSRATLDELGNLRVVGMATRDLRPGFRFLLAVVSKEGVVTVNGKALPK